MCSPQPENKCKGILTSATGGMPVRLEQLPRRMRSKSCGSCQGYVTHSHCASCKICPVSTEEHNRLQTGKKWDQVPTVREGMEEQRNAIVRLVCGGTICTWSPNLRPCRADNAGGCWAAEAPLSSSLASHHPFLEV